MEVNENHSLLAYANVIINKGISKNDVANSMSNWMHVGRYTGLLGNQERTKYVYITVNDWGDEDESHLEVDGLSFQRVHDFQHLGVNTINRKCVYNDIKLLLKNENKC